VCTKYRPPDGLQLTEVEKPTPNDNEVLVKVYATTVTSGDMILRSLKFPLRILFGLAFGLGKNKILGHGLAGEIEEVGKDVRLFEKGDQISTSTGTRGGAHAQYMCLPEDGMVTAKPANMTFEEAAAVPFGALSALYFLRKGNIRSGQEVLINGASGAVGTAAVQLAKYFKAEVTGVCSTTNMELVKSLGANKVIDYTKQDFTKNGETYDIIYDTVGKSSFSHIKSSLKKEGIFLAGSMTVIQGQLLSMTSGKKIKAGTEPEKAEDLIFLRELVEGGKLISVIDRLYPLEQIPEAHRYVD